MEVKLLPPLLMGAILILLLRMEKLPIWITLALMAPRLTYLNSKGIRPKTE
jgi:hypothetical protein